MRKLFPLIAIFVAATSPIYGQTTSMLVSSENIANVEEPARPLASVPIPASPIPPANAKVPPTPTACNVPPPAIPPPPCSLPNFVIIDYAGQTPGALVSSANIAAGAHNIPSGATWSTTVATMAYVVSPFSIPTVGNAKMGGALIFAPDSGIAVVFHSTNSGNFWRLNLPGTQGANLSVGFPWVQTGSTTVNGDTCDIYELNAPATMTVNLTKLAGINFVRIEESPPGTNTYGHIAYTPGGKYYFSFQFRGSSATSLATLFNLATNPPTQICSTADIAPDGCSIAVPMLASGNPTQTGAGSGGSCAATTADITFGLTVVDTNGVGLINP